MSVSGSVGSLLADIANLLSDALRIFSLSDKRHWGPDEHEQVHALEDALDEAKKDFQELSPLVSGQSHYEHDRRFQSVEELQALRRKFSAHVQCLKDWSRSGGAIDPMWVRETQALQKELHRAQYRAAGRIFTTSQESSERCLGAFLVRRQQRAWAARPHDSMSHDHHRQCVEELRICNEVGGIERFGDDDIAFICDFCDGHIVWEDLETMPNIRSVHQDAANSAVPPSSPTSNNLQWQARGAAVSTQEEKQVVFAPLAIANHTIPRPGDWQARLICSFCEEDSARPQDEDDDEDGYRPEYIFDDLADLQEHLEWWHAPSALPTTIPVTLPSTDSCQIM